MTAPLPRLARQMATFESPSVENATTFGGLWLLAAVLPALLLLGLDAAPAWTAEPFAFLLSGPLLGRCLSPLGDRLPWDDAAAINLRTSRIFADSAHTRLVATKGAPAAIRMLAGGPGQWLATDGRGIVVLANREWHVLSWRRPRLS